MKTPHPRETARNLLETSAIARDNRLIDIARLEFGPALHVGDQTDMVIAREAMAVTAQMRHLDYRGSLMQRLLGRPTPSPVVKREAVLPLLELSGVCATSQKPDIEPTLVDSFIVQVLQHKASQKDALSITRQITDTGTGESERVYTWGSVVEGDNGNEPDNITITKSEGPQDSVGKVVSSIKILAEYTEKHPWLSAFRIWSGETGDLTVQARLDGQLKTLQALVGGNDTDSERLAVIAEINGKIAESNRWKDSDEKSNLVALGVLLSVKNTLDLKQISPIFSKSSQHHIQVNGIKMTK